MKELRTFSNPDAKVFLIGNKADLENKRKVGKELGEKYKEDYNLDFFCETSAKNGMNAQKVFVEAAKVLYLDYLKYKDKIDKSRSSSMHSSIIKKKNTITQDKSRTPNNSEIRTGGGCSC